MTGRVFFSLGKCLAITGVILAVLVVAAACWWAFFKLLMWALPAVAP